MELLCLVMGMDFNITVNEVHPSLGNSEVCRNISNKMIQKLAMAIQKLREDKIQRMQKVHSANLGFRYHAKIYSEIMTL